MAHAENIAIIPARGGSKGVPLKNLKPLAGRPLISYAILCAQKAASIDRVVVSTDCDTIAQVAQTYGAQVIMRPAAMATDEAPTEPAMQHAVTQLESQGIGVGHIALIQCTCPFRLAADIDAGFALLAPGRGDAVMSVSEVPGHFHPYWLKKEDAHGCLHSLYTEPDIEHGILETQRYWRRQDLPGTYFWKNGALYIMSRQSLMEWGHRYGSSCLPLKIDAERLVNIDSEADFRYAEHLVKTGNIHLDF